jgi:YtxH-like protein
MFLHLHTNENYRRERHMRFRKREPLVNVLLDTGLHLLDSLRERLPDNVDDLKDRVRDTYDTASDRVSRATNALRGEEDSQVLGKVGALVIGVGIGVGIGLLIAPTTGEETRADLAEMVSGLKDKFSEATGKKAAKSATENDPE